MIINQNSFESFDTPQEDELLEKFKSKVRQGKQYQLWHRDVLKGTYWTEEEAQHDGEHLWDGQGFDAFTWTHYWDGTGWANLRIQSPVDTRWMAAPTFVLEVQVIDPRQF